ncbi:MAG TPA: hypothetical protein VI703_12425 [Anaerolineales bacterium]|nr:hypothetical protein [Anaerolineales bacterium]
MPIPNPSSLKRTAGYSGTPLVTKLGIKPGLRICILHSPDNYPKTLGPLPDVKLLRRLPEDRSLDFIHYFTKQRKSLVKDFPRLAGALNWTGTLWISWPKGASKVSTDLSENIVREVGLDLGLVDVKVAAIDEVWSGLKFVHRVEKRPK